MSEYCEKDHTALIKCEECYGTGRKSNGFRCIHCAGTGWRCHIHGGHWKKGDNWTEGQMSRPIVETMKPQARKGLLGIFSSTMELPKPQVDVECFLARRQGDGSWDLDKPETGTSRLKIDPETLIVLAHTDKQVLNLRLTAVKTDARGHAWDVTLQGWWRVSNAQEFLKSYGLRAVSPASALTNDMVETRILSTIRQHVCAEVRNRPVEEQQNRDALPVMWWTENLRLWLKELEGLEIEVVNAPWESADKNQAEMEAQRLADMQAAEKASRQQEEAKLARMRLEAAHNAEKSRIENDSLLDQKRQEEELAVLETQHHKKILEAEEELANARRASERAALEHQITMARLRNNHQAEDTAVARQEEADKHHQEMMAMLAKTQELFNKRDEQREQLLKQLASQNSAHQAAERLTSPEFGMSPQTLGLFGFKVPVQLFVDELAHKAQAEGKPVTIAKQEIQTRDIKPGNAAMKAKSLKIGQSLAFTFTSRRNGYVTMLNLGTTGLTWLHIPSALCDIEAAQAQAGRYYNVPGRELFPWEYDYYEDGPKGWEHIVVIVSDKPLIDKTILSRANPEMPIIQLSPQEVEQLRQSLAADEKLWSAGVLSFYVVD